MICLLLFTVCCPHADEASMHKFWCLKKNPYSFFTKNGIYADISKKLGHNTNVKIINGGLSIFSFFLRITD